MNIGLLDFLNSSQSLAVVQELAVVQKPSSGSQNMNMVIIIVVVVIVILIIVTIFNNKK